jgi:hypothetical protein
MQVGVQERGANDAERLQLERTCVVETEMPWISKRPGMWVSSYRMVFFRGGVC